MPNTQAIGVAFADQAIINGSLDSATLSNSNVRSGFSASQQGATITTTGNSDVFVVAPVSGVLSAAWFSGVDGLAASDSNFITFSITNLGTSGSGTATMLAATDANTTKVTGGTALTANARRVLSLNGTAANLVVAAGDRIRIRAAATGTLANTVTFPVYTLNFAVS